MSEFDNFFGAIAQQESGGSYSAVNARTGASGKYQIMPANIFAWSKRYLGYGMSVEEFRRDPKKQDTLARAVLQDYYRRYGVRGAAAAWYSGSAQNADNYRRFRSDEPSVGEYVDQVMQRANSGRSNFEMAGAEALPQAQPMPSKPLGLDAIDGTSAGLGASYGTPAQTASPAPPQVALEGSQGYATSSATGLRKAVVDRAMKMLGTPYVWGGEGSGGVDCSGLTKIAYGSIGVRMDHYHANQLALGKRISLDKLKPGDLVGWDGAEHVAMYIGNGMIIEAPQAGQNVHVRKLFSGTFDTRKRVYGVDMSAYLN